MAEISVEQVKDEASKFIAVGPEAGKPAPVLLGKFPLKRVMPIDMHALMVDYMGGTAAMFAGIAAGGGAKLAGNLLGLSGLGVAAMTDYRLSFAKIIPIEVHEVIDYVWGFTAMLSPFVFGYFKKHKFSAFAHIMLGATAIVSALFTDYRSQRDIHWSIPEDIAVP